MRLPFPLKKVGCKSFIMSFFIVTQVWAQTTGDNKEYGHLMSDFNCQHGTKNPTWRPSSASSYFTVYFILFSILTIRIAGGTEGLKHVSNVVNI